jgi:Matrixin/Putative peptidoglycan binding domain
MTRTPLRSESVWTARRRALAFCLIASTALPAACEVANTNVDEAPALGDETLALGARGPAVTAVQDYLTAHGYLPNDELARNYPRWRPIVPRRPTGGLFDQTTQAAVRALQTARNEPPTGVVDSALAQLMQQPRCGVPDGIPTLDGRDKFHLHNAAWNITQFAWKLANDTADDGISGATARAHLTQAFNQWQAVTNLQFADVTNMGYELTPILIQFVDFDTLSDLTTPAQRNALAHAYPPGGYNQGLIRFNTKKTWSTMDPTPAGSFDFQSVALHEIGHMLGLQHSSVGTQASVAMNVQPVSGSGFVQNRVLSSDDKLAISILYSPWQFIAPPAVSGTTRDIGVSGTGTTDVPWLVAGDGSIWKYSAGTWTRDTTGPTDGWAIAVQPNGRPWVVRWNGQITRKNSNNPTTGTWTTIPGCALDIGVGTSGNGTGGNGEGTVWIIGCLLGSNGELFRLNGTGNGWDKDAPTGGGPAQRANRVAVDSAGQPYVFSSLTGTYSRKNSSFAVGGTWQPIDSSFVVGGGDIGVFRGGPFVWAWTTTQSPAAIWVWNEQPGTASDGNCFDGACPRNSWQWDDGFASRVSVGPCGPWLVDGWGNVHHKPYCQGP